MLYKCKECGYEFKISKDKVFQMECNREYIECPINTEHKGIKIIEDIEKIMQERSAVEQ